MPPQNLSWLLQGPQPLSYIQSLFPKACPLSLEMLRWYLTLLEEQSQHSVPPTSPETELWPLQIYEHIQLTEAERFLSPAVKGLTVESFFFVWGELHLHRGLLECTLYYTTHTPTPTHTHTFPCAYSILMTRSHHRRSSIPSPWPHPAFCLHQNSHSYHQLGASAHMCHSMAVRVLGAPVDIYILQHWMYT